MGYLILTTLKKLFYILTIISFASCGQSKNPQSSAQQLDSVKTSKPNDTLNYTIIMFDTADRFIFENATPTDLSTTEINDIEILLKDAIDNSNKVVDNANKTDKYYQENKQYFIIDLSKYSRQFVPVINKNGEKEIWVNCYCGHQLQKKIILVQDGGNCFFNLKINLTTKKYYDLIINSDA